MILGCRTGFTSNDVGARFLMGKTRRQEFIDRKDWLQDSFLRATHLYTVESVSGREMAARDQDGTLRLFEIDYRGELQGQDALDLMWQGELPAGSFDEIATFATALLSEKGRSSQHPFAFHVVAVGTQYATVNLVAFPSQRSYRFSEEEMAKDSTIVGNALFGQNIRMDVGDHEWRVGAFVVANGFSMRIEDDRDNPIAEAKQLTAILEAASRADIGAWLPVLDRSRPGILGGDWTRLGCYDDFQMEWGRACARSEPNRALFYFYPDDPAKPQDTTCHCMGHEGIAFYDVDSINDWFWNTGLDHGLWILDDAKWWVDNGWEHSDAGIEGDWRRATAADLEHFGFDLATADQELADIREVDLEPGLAERLLAITDEDDRVREEAEKAARAALADA